MTPLGNHYLVRRVPAEETRGALIIPETCREKGQMFEVLAAGPGRVLDCGAVYPMQAAAGDGVVVLEHHFQAAGDVSRAITPVPALVEMAQAAGWQRRVTQAESRDGFGSRITTYVEWRAPDGKGLYAYPLEAIPSRREVDECPLFIEELRKLLPVPELGFVRDEHLVAVDRGDGLEPAGDYVQIMRDRLDRVRETDGGVLVAAYSLPGGEVREREEAGDPQARAYQGLTRTEAPRSGFLIEAGPGAPINGRRPHSWPYWIIEPRDEIGCVHPIGVDVMPNNRVHWEKHLQAVAIGEHVYVRADDLCCVEVGE